MRYGLALAAAVALLSPDSAFAVTITNLDQSSVRVFVCDDNCGPSHGEDWGSARDFWLAGGEAKSFDCTGSCFVGIYYDDHSPTLGDMAVADDDEIFIGSESGYVRNGIVAHKAN
jgi:hypothetical protein